MSRVVVGVLGVALVAWHLVAGLWSLAGGLGDWMGWLFPYASMPDSMADQVALDRAMSSGFVLGSLSLLGAGARLVGASLTVLALAWGLGGRGVRVGVCLLGAFGLHLVAVVSSAGQLLLAGHMDRMFLNAWWGEAGWFETAEILQTYYVPLCLGWHALALIVHGGLAVMMASLAVRASPTQAR